MRHPSWIISDDPIAHFIYNRDRKYRCPTSVLKEKLSLNVCHILLLDDEHPIVYVLNKRYDTFKKMVIAVNNVLKPYFKGLIVSLISLEETEQHKFILNLILRRNL
jgi:hypothetical protein